MKVISPAMAVTTLLLTVTGCASVGARQTAASEVAQRMSTAVHNSDGQGACALLAPATAAEVAQSDGKSCTQAILD
jgi:uncharacterized protein YceK